VGFGTFDRNAMLLLKKRLSYHLTGSFKFSYDKLINWLKREAIWNSTAKSSAVVFVSTIIEFCVTADSVVVFATSRWARRWMSNSPQTGCARRTVLVCQLWPHLRHAHLDNWFPPEANSSPRSLRSWWWCGRPRGEYGSPAGTGSSSRCKTETSRLATTRALSCPTDWSNRRLRNKMHDTVFMTRTYAHFSN